MQRIPQEFLNYERVQARLRELPSSVQISCISSLVRIYLNRFYYGGSGKPVKGGNRRLALSLTLLFSLSHSSYNDLQIGHSALKYGSVAG